MQYANCADMFSYTQVTRATLPLSCTHLAQRKQGITENKTTTKTTYSASVETRPKSRKKVLSIKKISRLSKQMKTLVHFVYFSTTPKN
jgi:hypothetical protein